MNEKIELYKKKRLLNCFKQIVKNQNYNDVSPDNISMLTPFPLLEDILTKAVKATFNNPKARYCISLYNKCYKDLHRVDPSVPQKSYKMGTRLKKL